MACGPSCCRACASEASVFPRCTPSAFTLAASATSSLINNTHDLVQALVATGFSYDASIRTFEAHTVAAVLPKCRDIRCMGSAALNLCWVGCGRLDGFYERDLKVYDYAAGALIASESGAVVERPDANDLDLMIAATSGIFPLLRALVATSFGG